MSETQQPGASPQPERPEAVTYGRPEKADWRRYARFTLWGILAVIAVLFVVLNSDSVEVSFIVFKATVPMFVALLVALGLGLVIGAGFVWMSGRRKAKQQAAVAKGKGK